jgi:hypothetical protein
MKSALKNAAACTCEYSPAGSFGRQQSKIVHEIEPISTDFRTLLGPKCPRIALRIYNRLSKKVGSCSSSGNVRELSENSVPPGAGTEDDGHVSFRYSVRSSASKRSHTRSKSLAMVLLTSSACHRRGSLVGGHGEDGRMKAALDGNPRLPP